jgi:transcriptional regulator with XRE-family HTH domain
LTEKQLLAYLKQKRLDRAWTLREAAEQSGLLPSTIWRIETGKSLAHLQTILMYANALDIDLILQTR